MALDRLTLKRRFRRFLGSSVEFDLAPYRARLARIDGLATEVAATDDAGLTAWARRLKTRVGEGTSLDQVLDELFALVREASERVLGARPFDEQIVGGLAMNQGRIAEMQTGEGKTLAAVAPVALNALAGRGAHVLTFNDYLARRDAGWMGPIYRMLGLTVGYVQEGMPPAERKAAYGCDVTYVTAREAGFDLLRDGLSLSPAGLVHRPFQFALVDEADSILIDEARIPLVIAGHVDESGIGLRQVAAVARELTPETDFTSDEHRRNVFLTDRGVDRVERVFDRGSLYDPENLHLLIALQNALHAGCLLDRDVDYIVRGGKVELVDDFTGRVADRRRWPDGLQAAIECKEGLEIQREGQILGSITVQHFLRSYPRLCGMTATAQPAAEELRDFYGLDVVVIPTHTPCRRRDDEDVIFADRAAKRQALVTEIARVHHAGRPILVGTASVVESEQLAAALQEAGVACRVLNAKHDEAEAQVVAEAGSLGAVTISTNMAGRGTDIKLGGRDGRDRAAVVARGGLYVIGTNRHESLRVDQQLRGRSGRQGDPGSSRFFVSVEDPIVARYGIRSLMTVPGLSTSDEPTTHPVLRREIRRAQRIIEGENLDIRRRLRDYSEVEETQRQWIQAWRREILRAEPPLALLAERSPARYARARTVAGDDVLRRVEQRVTLLALDRQWSNHLAQMRWKRDRLPLIGLVGKNPLAEFFREAGDEFDRLPSRVEDQAVRTFEQIEVTADGVDWEQDGLLGPSSTWTYLVNDEQLLGNNVLRDLSHRPGAAAWAVIALGPLLFLWGLRERWIRRRKRAARDTP